MGLLPYSWNDWGASRDVGGESPGCEEEKSLTGQRNPYPSPTSPEGQRRPQAKAAGTPWGGVGVGRGPPGSPTERAWDREGKEALDSGQEQVRGWGSVLAGTRSNRGHCPAQKPSALKAPGELGPGC